MHQWPGVARVVLQTPFFPLNNPAIHSFPPNLPNIITPKPLELWTWNLRQCSPPLCVTCQMSCVSCNITSSLPFFLKLGTWNCSPPPVCHVSHGTCHVSHVKQTKKIFCFKTFAYGRDWISQPMRIVSSLPWREKNLMRGSKISFFLSFSCSSQWRRSTEPHQGGDGDSLNELAKAYSVKKKK